MHWYLAAGVAAAVSGWVVAAAAAVAARVLLAMQKSQATWYCSGTESCIHSLLEILSGLGAVTVSNLVGVSCWSDLLERVGEGCGETSFCVFVCSNCEECGVDGKCASFGCLSDFFHFAWGLSVMV